VIYFNEHNSFEIPAFILLSAGWERSTMIDLHLVGWWFLGMTPKLSQSYLLGHIFSCFQVLKREAYTAFTLAAEHGTVQYSTAWYA